MQVSGGKWQNGLRASCTKQGYEGILLGLLDELLPDMSPHNAPRSLSNYDLADDALRHYGYSIATHSSKTSSPRRPILKRIATPRGRWIIFVDERSPWHGEINKLSVTLSDPEVFELYFLLFVYGINPQAPRFLNRVKDRMRQVSDGFSFVGKLGVERQHVDEDARKRLPKGLDRHPDSVLAEIRKLIDEDFPIPTYYLDEGIFRKQVADVSLYTPHSSRFGLLLEFLGAEDPRNLFTIVGGPRTGKTQFLCAFLKEQCRQNDHILVWILVNDAIAGMAEPRRILYYLTVDLRRRRRLYPLSPEPRDELKAAIDLRDALQDYDIRRGEPRIVVFIDGADKTEDTQYKQRSLVQLLKPILKEIPRGPKFVIASRLTADFQQLTDKFDIDLGGHERTLHLGTESGSEQQPLEVAATEDALAYLAQLTGRTTSDLPKEAHEIVAECENAFLALSMVAATMRDKLHNWKELLQDIRRVDLSALANRFPSAAHRGVLRVIEMAAASLDPKARDLFTALEVFPSTVPISATALRAVWSRHGLDPGAMSEMISTFNVRSLLSTDSSGSPRLHWVVREYLEGRSGDTVSAHNDVLHAYSGKCPGGWPTGPNDGYFFENLVYHLLGAARHGELVDLLTDLRWLSTKLAATNVFSLMHDFAMTEHLRNDAVQMVRRTLELTTHILNRDGPQLADQILMHLFGATPAAIQRLVAQARTSPETAAIVPFGPGVALLDRPLIRTLADHNSSLEGLRILDGGNTICSFTNLLTFYHWDAASGVLQGTADLQLEHSVASRSGPMIVLGSRKSKVLDVFELCTGAKVGTLAGHRRAVTCASDYGGGQLAVTGSEDCTLRLWNLRTLKQRGILTGHTRPILAVRATDDGKWAVSSAKDGTVRVWDLEFMKEVRVLTGIKEEYTFLALSPDGAVVALSTEKDLVKVWRADGGKDLRELDTGSSWVSRLVIDPDGQTLVCGSQDGELLVWSLVTYELLARIPAHRASVTGIAFPSRGSYVATASDDKTVKIWKWPLSADAKPACIDCAPRVVAASRRGGYGASSAPDFTVDVWNLGTGQRHAMLEGHEARISGLAFTQDASRVVSLSDDETLRVWDTESGKQLGRWEVGTCFDSLVVDDADAVAFFLSSDGILRRVHIGSGERLPERPVYEGLSVLLGASNRIGRAVIQRVFPESGLTVIDLVNGGVLFSEEWALGAHVDVTPDCRWAAVVADVGDIVRVIDLLAGRETNRLGGPQYWPIGSVNITSDGSRVIIFSGHQSGEDDVCRVTVLERMSSRTLFRRDVCIERSGDIFSNRDPQNLVIVSGNRIVRLCPRWRGVLGTLEINEPLDNCEWGSGGGALIASGTWGGVYIMRCDCPVETISPQGGR